LVTWLTAPSAWIVEALLQCIENNAKMNNKE